MSWRPSSAATAVPPPVVTSALAAMMAMLSPALPAWSGAWGFQQALAVAIAAMSLVLMLVALATLAVHRTTFNPLRPESASYLVVEGLFGCSRNPIYLADVLVLCAWVLWLGDAWQFWGPVALWLWLNQMQIPAEERALQSRFGQDFDAYCQVVKRWWGRAQ